MSNEAEKKLSLAKVGIPILIDPTLFRSLGAGQVDLCWHLGKEIQLWEVKSGPRLGKSQRQRYRRGVEILLEIFKVPCRFKVAVSRKDYLKFMEATHIL